MKVNMNTWLGIIKLKPNWKVVARTIISAGLLVWLALTIKWQDLGQIWSQLEPDWVLAAIAGIVISMIISVSKWQLVLDAQDIRLSWSELWRSYWAGLFFNNFLPSSMGGDAMRIWWVGKTAQDNPGAAASVIVERIIATTGLALTGLAGAALVSRPDGRAVTLFAILIVMSLIGLGLICGGALPRWTEPKKGRVIYFLRGMARHGIIIQHHPGKLILVGILSVAFQFAVIGVNYCIFQALHLSLSWCDLLYIIPVISVAAMLPLGINGYGLREGAYVVLLGVYDIPASTAFSASLLFVFLVSLCSLYGGYTWLSHRTKGESEDVKVQGHTSRPGRDEVWQ